MNMCYALHHSSDALGGAPLADDVLQNLGAVKGIMTTWPVIHCQQNIGDSTMGQQAFVHRQGDVNEGRARKVHVLWTS